MTNRIIQLTLAGIGLLILSGMVRAENGDSVQTNLLTLLETHDKGLKNKDMDLVIGSFSEKPDTVLMGTGKGEVWVGRDQIRDAYGHFFADYDHGAMQTHCTWHDTGSNGQVAWLVAMCQVTDYFKNIRRDYSLNISGIAENEEGTWRFRSLHFSNLTAPE